MNRDLLTRVRNQTKTLDDLDTTSSSHYLSIYLFIHLFIFNLFIYFFNLFLFIYFFNLFVYLLIHLFIYVFIYFLFISPLLNHVKPSSTTPTPHFPLETLVSMGRTRGPPGGLPYTSAVSCSAMTWRSICCAPRVRRLGLWVVDRVGVGICLQLDVMFSLFCVVWCAFILGIGEPRRGITMEFSVFMWCYMLRLWFHVFLYV
jgi:hypothetical protein